ncbi:MAG: hypothetical protein EON93_23610, partial [Burkholderiales bacterium]
MSMDPVFAPMNTRRVQTLPAHLHLPHVAPTTDTLLEHAVKQRLAPEGLPENALGRMEDLALQLARIQNGGPLP